MITVFTGFSASGVWAKVFWQQNIVKQAFGVPPRCENIYGAEMFGLTSAATLIECLPNAGTFLKRFQCKRESLPTHSTVAKALSHSENYKCRADKIAENPSKFAFFLRDEPITHRRVGFNFGALCDYCFYWLLCNWCVG